MIHVQLNPSHFIKIDNCTLLYSRARTSTMIVQNFPRYLSDIHVLKITSGSSSGAHEKAPIE